MRPGVYLDDFESSVLDVFGFLQSEEGFDSRRSEKTQYVLRVDFIRRGMLVRFEYSLRNDTIVVRFYRDPESIPTIPMNYDEATTLSTLLTYDGYPYSYFDSMMPYNTGGIAQSLKQLAASFHQHAMRTIHGEEWISLNMVREKHRRKGPE